MEGIIALNNKNSGDDEHLEAWIKGLEIETNTTKNRLESLESWVVKQDEKLKEVENKVKENDETIRNMKEIINNFEDVPKNLMEVIIKSLNAKSARKLS